jgi:hypothetical protein
MSSLLDDVWQGEVSYFSYMVKPRQLTLLILGIVLLAVGAGVLFGVGKPGTDAQTKQQRDAMWAGVGVGGAGVLALIVLSILMFIHDPAIALLNDAVGI